MSKTNAQAVAAFIRQEPADALHLHSDGTVLRSYGTPIARWHDDTIVVSSQHHSVTTTRHHSELQAAATAAGFIGPAHWQGNPDRKANGRRKGEEPAPTVPFHDSHFPASSNGRARNGSYHYGEPRNQSDHDARAVVWTFSQASYDEHAGYRQWLEQRDHVTLSRKEYATD